MPTDTNGLPRISAELRKIQKSFIDVGVLGKEGSEKVIIAASNEFGATIEVTDKVRKALMAMLFEADRKDLIKNLPPIGGAINIPSRSFVRSTFDDPKAIDKAFKFLEFGIDRILAGDGTALQAMQGAAASMISSVQLKIRSNIEPSNNPITLALKANDRTLVVEGSLSGSISAKIDGAVNEEVAA